MALFPTIPYGALQTDSTAGAPGFKYHVKRSWQQRSDVYQYADQSFNRFSKGYPITTLELSWSHITTAWKSWLKNFYDQQLGNTHRFSTSFDGVNYAGCRFADKSFKALNISYGLWNVQMTIQTTNTIGISPIGSGARVIVPSTAKTYTIAWKSMWNRREASYVDGEILVTFNGTGGATMTYVAASGGDGISNGGPTSDYYNQWGVGGVMKIEPSGALGVGPNTAATGLVAGTELVIQMTTTGGGHTVPGTVFETGPGYVNSDGEEHAYVVSIA